MCVCVCVCLCVCVHVHVTPTYLHERLVEDRSQGWVQLLLDVLEEDWSAKLDGVLQSAEEVRLLQVNDLQALCRHRTASEVTHHTAVMNRTATINKQVQQEH